MFMDKMATRQSRSLLLAFFIFISFHGCVLSLQVQLDVNPPYTEFNTETDISIILDPREDTTCMLYFGDDKCGDILTFDDFLVQMGPTLFGVSRGYYYADFGVWEVTVECENDGIVVTMTGKTEVIEALKGVAPLSIHDEPLVIRVEKGVYPPDSFVNYTFTTGTYVSAHYTVDGKVTGNETILIDETARTGSVRLRDKDFSQFGLHNVTLIVTNPAAWFPSEFTVEVINEEAIDGLQIDMKSYAELDGTTEMTAFITAGSNVRYSWLLDGFPLKETETPNFTFTFDALKSVVLSVNASNIFGFETAEKHIDIVKPVSGFTVSRNAPSDDIIVHAPSSEYFPMGNLSVEISVPTQTSPPIFLNIHAGENISVVNTLPKGTVNVRIYSAIAEQMLTLNQTWSPLSVQLALPDRYVRADSNAEIHLVNSSGPGFGYVLDLGDGNQKTSQAGILADVLSEDIVIRHIYTSPGTYYLKLNASNPQYDTQQTGVIFVQNPVSDFSFRSELLVVHPPGKAMFTSSLLLPGNPATNASCRLDFGDSSMAESTSWLDALDVHVEHEYVTPGQFTASRVCLNEVSQAVRSWTIEVKEYSYEDFNISYNPVIAMNASQSNVTVKFVVDLFGLVHPPSNVVFSWSYGDRTLLDSHELTSWVKHHTFTNRGNFNITINITTPTGSGVLDNMLIRVGIVDFYSNATLGGVGLDVFGLSISGAFGSPVHYLIDFDDGEKHEADVNSVDETFVFTLDKVYDIGGTFRPKVLAWSDGFSEEVFLREDIHVQWTIDSLLMEMEQDVIQQTGSGILRFMLPDGSSISTDVSCSVDFDDGETVIFPLNITDSSPVNITHRFASLGRLQIRANCSNRISSKTLVVTVNVINECYGSARPFSNFESPVRKFVSQQLTITAKPDIRCTNMSSEFLWNVDKIINGTETHVNIVQPNTTVLVLKARTMDPGEYKITFYTNFKELPTSYSADVITVIFERSSMFAYIKGGTLKTISFQHPVVLDALSRSRDPDVDPFMMDRDLVFAWTYTTRKTLQEAKNALERRDLTPCNHCLEVDLENEGVLVFTPRCLLVNRFHLFTISVSKSPKRATYTQIIHIVYDTPPQIDIRCKVNCHEKVNAEFSFNVESECLDCTNTEMNMAEYEWKMYNTYPILSVEEEEMIDFYTITSTGVNISTMSILPNSLEPGMAYRLELRVSGMMNRSVGIVSLDFVVNFPPYNGSCFMTPLEGLAVLDRFQLVCENWLDEGSHLIRSDSDSSLYLSYQFTQHGENKPSLIYSGDNRKTAMVEMNAGRRQDDYKVTIIAKIFDTNKGMASMNITGRVIPPLKEFSAINNRTNVDSVLGSFDNRLERAMLTGDIQDVSRVAESSASVLNVLVLPNETTVLPDNPEPWLGPKPADLSEDNGTAKTWKSLWTDLLAPHGHELEQNLSRTRTKYAKSVSSTLRPAEVTSLDTIHQVSSSLDTVLQNPYLVTDETLGHATESMSKLGDSLSTVVTEDMSDTETGEVLDVMMNSVGSTLQAVIPEHRAESGPIDVTRARKAIAKSRSYANKEESKAIESEMKDADLQDEERAFFLTRQTMQQQFVGKKKQRMANDLVKPLHNSINQALDAASKFLVRGQRTTTFTNPKLSASVERNTMKAFLNRTEDIDGVLVKTKPTTLDNVDEIIDITIKTTIYRRNPFIWDKDGSSDGITSPAVRLSMTTDKGHGANSSALSANISQTIWIPNSDPVTFSMVVPHYIPLDHDQLLYHRMELKSTQDSLTVYLKPSFENMEYDIYFRAGEFPTADIYHYKVSVKRKGHESDALKAVCPPNTLPQPGTIYIGLKPLPQEIRGGRKKEAPLEKEVYGLISSESENFTQLILTNYEIGMSTVGCKSWQEEGETWVATMCMLTEQTNENGTECVCQLPMLSLLTMAQTFYVPVNTIDFSTVFSKIDLKNNASVFICVLALLAVYAMSAIWARRKDKMDVLKWGVTSLIDNFPQDRYFYIITVYTGMRIGAGTKSKVGFVVAGEDTDTGIRQLYDGIRNEISSRSIMHFLLAVPSCLGDIQYIRLWHDNSGRGSMASWFLHKVVVEDIQTDIRCIFKCDRWLAVEKEDGMIERVLPLTVKEDLATFSGVFYNNTRKNFTDDHLWFSVILRPQRSHFTRLQRLSCCLCLLFLSMIGNAMFYHSEENVVRPAYVRLGVFRFSLQQLYVSFICLVIVMPVNIIIVWLFKTAKPGEDDMDVPGNMCSCCFFSGVPDDRVKLKNALIAKGFHNSNNNKNSLPHFCIYIAWSIVFLCVLLSGFFLFLFSQQWGKSKTEEWLSSFVLSFLESLLIVDPLKVVIVAAGFALFVRKPDESASEGLDKDEIKSKENINAENEGCERESIEPLAGDDLKKAQTAKVKETKAFGVLREIILYIVFLLIVFTLGYSNRDPRSFVFKTAIENMLVKPKLGIGFGQIQTTENFFHWVNKTVFPALFQQTYYQGSRRVWWDRYYIRDLQSYRVGPPRIRQVRSPSIVMCYKRIMGEVPCNAKYNMYDEESRDFCIGWSEPPCTEEEKVYEFTSAAWKFTSSEGVLAMPVVGYYNTYRGGGYIAELDVNLDVSTTVLNELFSKLWVDRQTRAVIIEFTVYNVNTNMFCYVNLMTEFPETGGTVTYNIIKPFRIYQHAGALGSYVLFNELIFVILVFIAIIQVMVKIRRHRCNYFFDWWHVNEFLCLLTCVTGMVIYAIREVVSKITMKHFHEDPKSFVNFYHITIWDEVLVNVIGCLTFICILRMIRILGYSKRAASLINVLYHAGEDLLHFSFMFFLLFMSFAQVAYLIFGHTLEEYRDMLVTCATLFTCMIGKSPFDEMRQMEPFFAQVYFSSFIFFQVFILLTVFLAILNESIARVRADQNDEFAQHDMVDLLLTRFKNTLQIFLPARLKELLKKRAENEAKAKAQAEAEEQQKAEKPAIDNIKETKQSEFVGKVLGEKDQGTAITNDRQYSRNIRQALTKTSREKS